MVPKPTQPALVPATSMDHAGHPKWTAAAPAIDPNAGMSEHMTKMSRQLIGLPASIFCPTRRI